MFFIAVPLLDYLRDPDVQAKIETAVEVSRGWSLDVMISCDAIFQVGRQFTFSNGSITVNTGALIAAGALALLGEGLINIFSSAIASGMYFNHFYVTPVFKVWPRFCFSCSPARTLVTRGAAATVTAMRLRTLMAMETHTLTADP